VGWLLGRRGDGAGAAPSGAAPAPDRIDSLLRELASEEVLSVQDPPRSVAVAAARLAGMGETAIEPLLEAAPRVGPGAAIALAWIGPPAIDPLERALAEGPPAVREAAVVALGLIGGRRVIPSLVGALDDPDAAVRARAENVLRSMARQLVADLRHAMRRDEAIACLELIGGPAVWPLAGVLRTPELGLFASSVLGRLGAAAVEPLVMVLVQARRLDARSDDPAFFYAATALAAIGEPAVDSLADVLRSDGEPEWVRAGAAHVLGRIAAPAVPRLLEALDSADGVSRRLAAGALGDSGDPSLVILLRRSLDDEVPEVRVAAHEAIARLGGG